MPAPRRSAAIDTAANPLFDHVSQIFADAPFLSHLGIRLDAVAAGSCDTSLTITGVHLQQHGIVHAGVVTTLADHTCGGAARAAVPAGSDVITIELKINFLRPARTARLEAHGRVLRGGRTVVVSQADVYAVDGQERAHVATCVSTLLVIDQRSTRDGGR